jgi:Protein of unknown function (DUF4242)
MPTRAGIFTVDVVARPRPPADLFLVERYLPAANVDELRAAVARVARSCDELRAAGADLRYLHSTYIPSEATCFCVFEAACTADLASVNETHGFRIDRISAAIALDDLSINTRTSTIRRSIPKAAHDI